MRYFLDQQGMRSTAAILIASQKDLHGGLAEARPPQTRQALRATLMRPTPNRELQPSNKVDSDVSAELSPLSNLLVRKT